MGSIPGQALLWDQNEVLSVPLLAAKQFSGVRGRQGGVCEHDFAHNFVSGIFDFDFCEEIFLSKKKNRIFFRQKYFITKIEIENSTHKISKNFSEFCYVGVLPRRSFATSEF